MSSSAIIGMQQAVRDCIRRNLQQDKNQVQFGTYQSDGTVVIGNRTYQANALADMSYDEGDYVYCLVPKSGNEAAIVGKM